MNTHKKLFALRMPGNWAVVRNFFGDEDQVIRDGVIFNDEFYKEDLLLIKPLHFVNTDWTIDQDGIFLDLGWYPDADPNGHYRLTLLRGDWDDVVLIFQSKDRSEVRSVIERCLDLITQGVNDKDIQQWIEIEYPDNKEQ